MLPSFHKNIGYDINIGTIFIHIYILSTDLIKRNKKTKQVLKQIYEHFDYIKALWC